MDVIVIIASDESKLREVVNKSHDAEIPFVKLEPVAVTKENMDEIIIDGGFHLKEDVYLNVGRAEAEE